MLEEVRISVFVAYLEVPAISFFKKAKIFNTYGYAQKE